MSWLLEGGKLTPRGFLEVTAMKKLFNPKLTDPNDWVVLRSANDWDRDIRIETVALDFNYVGESEPYWKIAFRMHPAKGVPRTDFHSNDLFIIKIVHLSGYPHQEPAVYVEQPNTRGSLHQFMDGRLCLYDHSSSRSSGWDPAKSTAATFGSWTVQWLRTWLYWRSNGQRLWPSQTY